MVHQIGPRHRVRTYGEPHVVRRRPWPYHVCCGGARTRASVSGAALSLLNYLDCQVAKCRHNPRAVEMRSWSTAPRVDTQTSESRTGVRGRHPVLDSQGRPDPWLSPWYSLELHRQSCEWLFAMSDKPPRSRPWLWSLNSNSSSATDHSLTGQRFLSRRRGRTIAGTVQHSTSLCRQGHPLQQYSWNWHAISNACPLKHSLSGHQACQQGSRRARKTAIFIVSIHHVAYLSSRVRCDGIFWMRPCPWAKQRKGTPRERGT